MAQPTVPQALLQSITVLLPYLRHYCSQSQYYYRISGTTAVNHSTTTVSQTLLQSITVLLPNPLHTSHCSKFSAHCIFHISHCTHSRHHNTFHAFLYWQVTYIFPVQLQFALLQNSSNTSVSYRHAAQHLYLSHSTPGSVSQGHICLHFAHQVGQLNPRGVLELSVRFFI